MPTSAEQGKAFARDVVLALDPPPQTVLDVGAGSGTWAALLRADLVPSSWTAVEIHEPYVARFKLNDWYDNVVVGDVRLLVDDVDLAADLVILGDVLEHMPALDAVTLLRRLAPLARHLLVSLPVRVWEQGAVDGNEHEAHVHHWDDPSVRDVLLFGHDLIASQVGPDVGVYLLRGGRP